MNELETQTLTIGSKPNESDLYSLVSYSITTGDELISDEKDIEIISYDSDGFETFSGTRIVEVYCEDLYEVIEGENEHEEWFTEEELKLVKEMLPHCLYFIFEYQGSNSRTEAFELSERFFKDYESAKAYVESLYAECNYKIDNTYYEMVNEAGDWVTVSEEEFYS